MSEFISFIKFNKKSKGSATVEATMIFPLIMFILFGIMYLTIIHYQNNVMIAESIRAMNRAGAYWQYIDMDINGRTIEKINDKIPTSFDSSIPQDGIINIEMIKNRNVYRSLIDVLSEGISKFFKISFGMKKKQTKQYVNSRLANVKFTQYRKSDDVISDIYGQGFMFFGDDLKVDVSRSYINPLLGIAKAFLGENNVMNNIMNKKIIVSSVISNQSEFVRNMDTAYEIGLNVYELIKPKNNGEY